MLRLTREDSTYYTEGSGAYPNLFDTHPPFQINGNFGGTSGVAEMLLKSQNNDVFLLPALPDAWKRRAVKGLRARGGFEVSIKWDSNKINEAAILSRNEADCKIRTNQPVYIKALNLHSNKSSFGYLLSFKTQPNKSYKLERIT